MVAAVILLLVVVGTVVFHFWSPWWWTEIASNWGYVDDTIIVTFWITGVVFVAILLLRMRSEITAAKLRALRRTQVESAASAAAPPVAEADRA